jgi:hypothetical protein
MPDTRFEGRKEDLMNCLERPSRVIVHPVARLN